MTILLRVEWQKCAVEFFYRKSREQIFIGRCTENEVVGIINCEVLFCVFASIFLKENF